MTDEEKSVEEIAQEELNPEQEASQEAEELSPEQQYETNQEDIAAGSGWKPLDQWVEGGGEAKDWVPASIFNVRGEFIGKLKAKDREIDSRLQNVNHMHEAQLEVQRKELIAQRDAAALEGGEENVEVVRNKQHQIDTLNATNVTTTATGNPPELDEWNANNPWASQPGAKSTYAQVMLTQAITQGNNMPNAIAMMEREVAREFPNQQRTTPTAAESEKGSKPNGFKKSEKKISMSDVTQEERKWRDALPGAWKTDDDFLQAVQDARKT